ncbi:hypothetical protein ERJ75_000517400 [Trypanosoma vivax]|nr:hypothetical protein ERJ75_000517400 [Trypanosoma vivax]
MASPLFTQTSPAHSFAVAPSAVRVRGFHGPMRVSSDWSPPRQRVVSHMIFAYIRRMSGVRRSDEKSTLCRLHLRGTATRAAYCRTERVCGSLRLRSGTADHAARSLSRHHYGLAAAKQPGTPRCFSGVNGHGMSRPLLSHHRLCIVERSNGPRDARAEAAGVWWAYSMMGEGGSVCAKHCTTV